MRNKDEIKDYLLLGGKHKNDDIINNELIQTAISIEQKYKKELESGKYGYGLQCDYECSPYILEDEDIVKELKFISNIDGIILYEIILN